MIIITIPILLGEGIPLFAQLSNRLTFECISSSVEKGIAQSHYIRKQKIFPLPFHIYKMYKSTDLKSNTRLTNIKRIKVHL